MKLTTLYNLSLNEDILPIGYIMYIYLCDKDNSDLLTYYRRFNYFRKEIKLIDNISDGGYPYTKLTYQAVLKTDSKNTATNIAMRLIDNFVDLDGDILIVLSKQPYNPNIPIGHNYRADLIRAGEYFDDLIEKKEKGIYFI